MEYKKDWIIIGGALLIISIGFYYLYFWFNILLNFQETFGQNGKFGYPFSSNWTILNIAFWIFVFAGFNMLFKQARFANSIVNGTLPCILTYLGVDLFNGRSLPQIGLEIMAIIFYLIYYNYRSNFKLRSMIPALIVFGLFGILFLTVNQH